MQCGVGCAGSENLKNSKLINYQDLLTNLKEIENSSPCVFAIDGVAGSGKTTLASKLQSDIPGSQVVHMDDLYSGWNDPLSEGLTKRVIDEILNPFLKGNEVIYRKFDWHQNVFGELRPKPLNREAVKSILEKGYWLTQSVLIEVSDLK